MAKPDNWDDMSQRDKIQMAQRLIDSTRGHLILGQALANAIKYMSHIQYPEMSNMEDMEILAVLFEPWFTREMSDTDFAQVRERIEQAYKA